MVFLVETVRISVLFFSQQGSNQPECIDPMGLSKRITSSSSKWKSIRKALDSLKLLNLKNLRNLALVLHFQYEHTRIFVANSDSASLASCYIFLMNICVFTST